MNDEMRAQWIGDVCWAEQLFPNRRAPTRPAIHTSTREDTWIIHVAIELPQRGRMVVCVRCLNQQSPQFWTNLEPAVIWYSAWEARRLKNSSRHVRSLLNIFSFATDSPTCKMASYRPPWTSFCNLERDWALSTPRSPYMASLGSQSVPFLVALKLYKALHPSALPTR